MIYLLDTNTLIYFFKNMGRVIENVAKIKSGQLAISSITLFELELGILKSNSPHKRIEQLGNILQRIRVLPFSEREAYQAAKIRQMLEAKGTPIGAYDILIAATALSYQATLVTHNTKEFSRIENLRLADWF